MKQRGRGNSGTRSYDIRRGTRPQAPKKRPAIIKRSRLMPGTTVTLPVKQVTEYGYFLHDGETDILLHRTEAKGELREGDQVEVFLYTDHQGRIAATMDEPQIRAGEYGWLEVVNIVPRMGVYLDNALKRDVLMFVDDLPKLRNEWPRVGDRVLVSLKLDKEGRLLAKPVTEEVIAPHAKPGTPDMLNKQLDGTVYKMIGAGAFLLTEGEHILFIHRDEMNEPLRLGQSVTCRVTYVREDGRLNGSLRARKEHLYREDADKLYTYLLNRGGSMPYTDDTPPDVIKTQFGMSKSAFKRALGKLLKERRIICENGWTRLTSQQ